MMWASGWAASCTMEAACSTSSRPMSGEPVMFSSTPRAPAMEVSSRGLSMAILAASAALSLPEARPMPIWAKPALRMMVATSLKSRLIRPGTVISSEMLCTAWRSTLSATSKAFWKVIFWSETSLSRSLGMTTRASTFSFSSEMPALAWSMRRRPSKLKGRVTTPTVRMPISLAIWATTGAPPVPVPPPIPAVIKTILAPSSILRISSSLS